MGHMTRTCENVDEALQEMKQTNIWEDVEK